MPLLLLFSINSHLDIILQVNRQFPHESSVRIICGPRVDYLHRTAHVSAAICAEKTRNSAEKLSFPCRTICRIVSNINAAKKLA